MVKRIAIALPGGRPVRFALPDDASWADFAAGACERLAIPAVGRVVEATSLAVEISRVEDIVDGDSLVVHAAAGAGAAAAGRPALPDAQALPRAPPVLVAGRQSSSGAMRMSSGPQQLPDWGAADPVPEMPPLLQCQQSSGGRVHLLAARGHSLFRNCTSPTPGSPGSSGSPAGGPGSSGSGSSKTRARGSPSRVAQLRVDAGADAAGAGGSPEPQPSPVRVSPRRLHVDEQGDEWMEAATAEGRKYYYNRRTRERTWKDPRRR